MVQENNMLRQEKCDEREGERVMSRSQNQQEGVFGGAFHEEGKTDNVVFVWRDWCVLGLQGPQSDCGTRDSLSDLGTCLFIFTTKTLLKIN